MTKLRFTPLAMAVALLFAIPISWPAAQAQTAISAEQLAVESNFADQPVAANATLILRFEQPFPYATGRFAVMLDNEDITAQFSLKDGLTLQGQFNDAPLPDGEHTLKVFGISADNEWAPVAELPLKVLGPAGGALSPARAVIKPGAVFQLKGQLADRRSATAPAAPRGRYADAAVMASLATDHGNAEWGLTSDTRVLAASNRREALQWGTRGEQARRADLASYLVKGVHQPDTPSASALSLGNVQAGDHPLLAAGIANRGVVFSQQLGARASLALSSQSSAALLGTGNLSGLGDDDNRFTLATLGTELMERAGGLRAEVTAFSGTRHDGASPGSSAVPPAHSRGLGLRLAGETEDRRWRGEVAVAQSENTPLVTRSGSLVGGTTERRVAYVIELKRELLQAQSVWESRPDLPLSLSAGVRRERTAPQYLSLGASTNADALNDSLDIDANLGPANAGIKLQRHHDNLDGDPTRTRNQAPTLALQLSLPLGLLISAEAPNLWWPTLRYSYGHNHDYGDPRYVPAGSTRATLSDAVGLTHTVGLNWQVDGVSAGYTLTRTARDERQVGQELNDSLNVAHALTLGWVASETLSLNGNFGWTHDRPLPGGPRTLSRSGGFTAEWAPAPTYQISAAVNRSRSNDQPSTGSSASWSGEAMFKHNFNATAFGLKVPGNVWLRGVFNHNAVRVASAPNGVQVRWATWTAGLGLAF